MRLTWLNDENLPTTTTENRCYVDFTIVFQILHYVTVHKEWLFVSKLLLKKDAPVFENKWLSLLLTFLYHLIVVLCALLKGLHILIFIERVAVFQLFKCTPGVQFVCQRLLCLQKFEQSGHSYRLPVGKATANDGFYFVGVFVYDSLQFIQLLINRHVLPLAQLHDF